MNSFKNLNKAKVLKKLKIKSAKIPYLISFTEKEFKNKNTKLLNKINKNFKKSIAIRSSNSSEDQEKKSFAGYFESFLNINPKDEKSVNTHIKKVFNSYKNYKNKKNEVIVQDMVRSVKISGVATSCDKDNFTPYYIINFSKSRDTSKITSGSLNGSTFVFYEKSKKLPKNTYLRKIIFLIRELTKICGNAIDIEFAYDSKKKLHLLQVRHIVKNKNYKNIHLNFTSSLNKLSKKIQKLKTRHYNLYGKTTLFGVMPDWNPAEMVGIKPNNLAISLYQELITDHIWSQDRKKFGYKDLTSHHLLSNFFGTPYVDIRIDFNSWLPKDLDNIISEKLINFYLDKFKKNTEFHDKVEFNIIFSCFSLTTKQKLKKLLGDKFKKSEINKICNSLKKITVNAFDILGKSMTTINKLIESHDKIINSNIYDIDKIYWLIEDCKKFGTSSFASIARCAFIANDFINSFEEKKIFTKEEKLNFLSSIKTIVSEMNNDLIKLNKKNFIKKYGHLRPSTYDINSVNYESGYSTYFSETDGISKLKHKSFSFSKSQLKKIDDYIKENKLPFDSKRLIRFIKTSISEREKSKFYFSKNIDSVFKLIEKIGVRNNIRKDDLGFINIKSILDLYYNLDIKTLEEKFKKEIKNNKKIYNFGTLIKLPQNIISSDDIFYFIEKYLKSNFVGLGDVTGKIAYVNKISKVKLKNKIVCIVSADPGYDYIFSKKIKGLVTMFGGVNSHMAIRCSELGIPAAIGVGERSFKEITNSKFTRLNTISKKIDIIN